LDHATAGQPSTASTIRWDFSLPDGATFHNPTHADLLFLIKHFVWSLFHDARNGRKLTAGSAAAISAGVRYLVRWMVRNDYSSLSQLDTAACDNYVDDLAKYLSQIDQEGFEELDDTFQADMSETDDYEVSVSALRRRLGIWSKLWRQSGSLRDAGIDPLPTIPFRGAKFESVAKIVAVKSAGWIEPVPDEVALPIMAAAHKMLTIAADDVMRLQQQLHDGSAASSQGTRYAQARLASKLITEFRFSSPPGEVAPWREPLVSGPCLSFDKAKWNLPHHDLTHVFRDLVTHICSACVIVLQSEAAMRINEICSLRSGYNAKTKLPACIEVRVSKTGLHELFLLKGTLSKLQPQPVQVEWLIGSRPVGSDNIPAPVRALEILQKLHEPLRKLADDASLRNDLIVAMSAPVGYPRRGGAIGRMTGTLLLRQQREFVGTFVDLSSLPNRNRHGQLLSNYRETRGACLRTHAWRKTFALYVFRTDPRMIPAIALQFHHLSLAMTEQGYIGNDPTLIEAMDSVRAQQTASFFFEMARGTSPVAGRLSQLIDKHRTELEAIVGKLGERDGRNAMERWVIDQDLRIWFASHGKCFLRLAPMQAKCHEIAGTSDWKNVQPNYAHRSPDVCLGCPMYAVDGEHSGFWIRRYLENQTAWNLAVEVGLQRDYRISEYRAQQSAAVLQAIGVGLPSLKTSEINA
jgi:integrase